MKQLALLALCAIFAYSLGTAPAEAAPDRSPQTTTASAINAAGRQRMLSQRIVKLYCQIGQGILLDKSKQQLQESVTLFDTQLDDLKRFTPNPGVKSAVSKVETAWGPVKELVAKGPAKENAKKLAGMSEELLKATHAATMALQDHAGSSSGRLVNLSGRQRMLSQRMAKLYMLKHWGITAPDMSAELGQARKEFSGALLELQGASENTPSSLSGLSR